MSKVRYPAYCPSHLAVHNSAWCTTHDHVSLADFDDPAAEARRRGFVFYHDDVDADHLRESADDPRVGDVVGDKRCMGSFKRFRPGFLREVVSVTETSLVWKRPGQTKTTETSRKSWRAWARGSWRCDPKNGEPTRPRWSPS